MKFFGIRFTLLVVMLCGGITVTFAESARSAHVEAKLVTDVRVVEPGGNFWVALRLKMDEGWHTYWKNPGDSGLATSIRWDLPEGLEPGPIHWPVPQRFQENDLMTYGYSGEVVLLVPFRATDELVSFDELPIKADVRWLSCEKICIPGRADLAVTISTTLGQMEHHDQGRALVAAAQGRLPLYKTPWTTRAAGHRKYFEIILTPPEENITLEEAYFFPGQNDVIAHAEPQRLKRKGKRYYLAVEKPSAGAAPETLEGVLSLTYDRGTGTERHAFAVDILIQ